MNILKQCISKTKNQVSRVIDGEAVIILKVRAKNKMINREVIVLPPMATRIWEALTGKVKVDNFLRTVSKELKVDYNQHQGELIRLMSKLIKSGLVVVSRGRR